MKELGRIIIYFGLIVLLTQCAAFGSKTLYKTDRPITFEPSRIGVSQLLREDILNQLVGSTGTYYEWAVGGFLKQKHIARIEVTIPQFNDFMEVDKDVIIELCERDSLDGILIGRLRYIFVDYYTLFIPMGQSQDTEVELQYYDSKGELVIHTRHNTQNGNTYGNMPSPDLTVRDGAIGALKKMFKEMEVE